MARKRLITEILAAHADQLLKHRAGGKDYARLFPDDADLPPLLSLADHVRDALQPVAPSPSFTDQLQRDLMAAAHLKRTQRAEGGDGVGFAPFPFLLPALIGALLALAGLLFLRRRQQISHEAA